MYSDWVAMGSSWTIQALRDELASLHDELGRRERRHARERTLLQSRVDALAEHASSEAARADRLRGSVRSLQDEAETAGAALAGAQSELTALEARVASGDELARRYAEQLEHQAELLRTLTIGIEEIHGDVERIAGSRAWRVGHGIARMSDRLMMRRRVTRGAVASALARLGALEQTIAALHAGRAGPSGRVADPPGAVTGPGATQTAAAGGEDQLGEDGRADLARRIRSQLGAPPRRMRLPVVSIVVLNRNGEAHLRRLLRGLAEHTDYPRFELIVVDNGSSDGSREYLHGLSTTFGLAVIENEDNVTFSAGNAQGAARATGDLLLFLNNDIEPFERGWLRELVALATRRGVDAAGATLLHAHELAAGVPVVQHRGIRVRFEHGRLQPYNLDDGGALFGERFGVDVDAPATTGACLMIDRGLFGRLGGFAEGYRYGTEDVDLGFRIVAGGGTVITSGRAHLLHRESSTQNAEGRAFMRENRLNNQRLFAERWGSRLQREYRLSRLRGDRYWAEGEGPHIAVTLTSTDSSEGYGDWYTGHELGDALERLGWRVSYVQRREDAWYTLPEGLDYLLVLLDAYDLRNVSTTALKIAWVRSWTERWLERDCFELYDLVLASSSRSAELISERSGVTTVEFPLATNPERFVPVAAELELATDLVFTGNYWKQPRDIQGFRPREDETLRVFGSGWEDVAELAPYTQGPVAYERLPAVYASAKVVIDDTALHTLPYGAINSRVFDALACGTVVVTNCEAGVHELFDAEFPTWSDQASLRARLDELLGDDARRRDLAQRYQRSVRERHTYAHRAGGLVAALHRAEAQLSFCIKTGAPSRFVAAEWGDVHFAQALGRELRRRGHRSIVQTLDEWDDSAGLYCDVVIHLRGLSPYEPKPGQFNVLWCISHPDELTVSECESYDLVGVASERFAATLRTRVSRPVVVLEQATDPRLFYPEPNADFDHQLLFVANSRKVMRRIMSDLLPTEHELAVYGTNWRGLIDERHIAGEHVPNAQLRGAYSSAAIVLNDHWDDMREHGFVSNRIYDALACGAVVVSDDLPELQARFADAVVTYSSRDELAGVIERLLRSPQEREQRGRRGRELVLGAHTFAHRVDQLLEDIGARQSPSRQIKPTPAAGGRGDPGGRSAATPGRAWGWRRPGRGAGRGRPARRTG